MDWPKFLTVRQAKISLQCVPPSSKTAYASKLGLFEEKNVVQSLQICCHFLKSMNTTVVSTKQVPCWCVLFRPNSIATEIADDHLLRLVTSRINHSVTEKSHIANKTIGFRFRSQIRITCRIFRLRKTERKQEARLPDWASRAKSEPGSKKLIRSSSSNTSAKVIEDSSVVRGSVP